MARPPAFSSRDEATQICSVTMVRRITGETVSCETELGRPHNMVLILGLLLVLILFGAGFAVHLLWIAAAIFAVVWLAGFALGRGEGAGQQHFYRW